MTILSFIRRTDLHHSVLLGYYGGGNYGDELLLEVLQNLLAKKGIRHVDIAYQHPEQFLNLHHDFGYRPFPMRSKIALLRATLRNRQIIVGGGGLWGVDMNLNTFLMSVYLWLSRWLLGKKVYLLGVGYYGSTSRLGHAGAWLAGKAATIIFARDQETYDNFHRIAPKRTQLDKDIAWYISAVPLAVYRQAAQKLGAELEIIEQTLFMTIRRPQAKKQHNAFAHFNQVITNYLDANPNKRIILAELELGSLDAAGQAQLQVWSKTSRNVHVFDAAVNPLVLYALFSEYRDRLALIGPQFHIILTAHLNRVPFLPISYDNKVRALLDHLDIKPSQQLALADVKLETLQQFTDTLATI